MTPYQPWPDPAAGGTPTGPSPCFYWRCCRNLAELEKAGKAVCRACAGRVRGREYPLRSPSRDPLYPALRDAADALDMQEPRRRKRDPIVELERYSVTPWRGCCA